MEFGPLVLQRTRGRTEIRKDLGKDDKGHKGTEAGSASRHGGRLGRVHPRLFERKKTDANEKERKKTDNPREGWEDGTPPPGVKF